MSCPISLLVLNSPNKNDFKKIKKRTSPIHDYLKLNKNGTHVCKICPDDSDNKSSK
ncbi:2411_t:CDS:2 [Cetraspora pellucida]|uniref:2411_t:CDS:1 n=1 Tax=Cetraspora pellucida TaxID=1433469 RepID=A0ACA9LB21_9GLOM|nr:2411_t:CDS:2 [Cetraspora pellucida]